MTHTLHPPVVSYKPYGPANGGDDAGIELVVILPTYQRPEPLSRTLRSLQQQTNAVPFAIIVIENHAAGLAGAEEARRFFEEARQSGAVLVEPRQGNCFAYNAGFHFARQTWPKARFVAVIDDDEVAAPDWLERLVAASRQFGADIVGGPQLPRFEDPSAEKAFGNHPVFQPSHQLTGPVPVIHSTGNCLIGTAVIDDMGHPLLDETFNFTGGGDSDFFNRCAVKGYSFAWCSEAAVFEIIPPRRTRRAWITARSLRNGMLSTLIQKKSQPGLAGRIRVIGKSLALLGMAPLRSAFLAARTGSLYTGSYHLMIATGRLLAEFGYAQEQYRRPEKN